MKRTLIPVCAASAALTFAALMAPSPSFAAEITTDNLVHRWSFNGNFDDTGSGTHQTVEVVSTAEGNVAFNEANTAVCMKAPGNNNNSYNTGHVRLGTNLIPTDSDGVTIEIFATPRQTRMWSRIFSYGSNNYNIDMCWTANNGNVNTDLAMFAGGSYNNTMAPFTLDTQWHISVVLKKDKNGGTWLRWMKRNVSTGEIVKYNSVRIGKTIEAVGENPPFWLGGSYFGRTDDAFADYDEVRIWNVALDDGQLSANAKAGPDVIPGYANPDSFAAYISTEDQVGRYIDTGLAGRSGTKVEAKFRQMSSSSQYPVFVGCDASDAARFHPIGFDYYKISYQYGASNSAFYDPEAYGKNLIVTSDFAANGTSTITVKDAATGNVLATDERTAAVLDTGRNMYLFANNGNTSFGDYFSGLCYYVKIWQTDNNGEYQLVRDYVPCVKNGVAGLYDQVSNTIFYQVGSKPFGYVLAGEPATATWNGSDANTSTPANWLCYDSVPALIANAVPSSGTAVTVDSNDPAPSVGSTIGWNSLVLGSASDKSGAIAFTTGASATFNSISAGASGTGSVTMGGDAVMAVNDNASIGQNNGANGTFSMADTSSAQFGTLNIGNNSGASGTLSINDDATAQFGTLNIGNSGSGSMTVGSNATVTVSGDAKLGQASGASGTLSMSGDATAQFSTLYIGIMGSGNMTISGNAEVTISGYSSLGHGDGNYHGDGAHGEVTQTGGTVTTGTDGNGFNIGRDGTGTYNLSGGTLNVRQRLRVGWGGNSSGNVFNMAGGTLNVSGGDFVVADWSKDTEFNMTGGTASGNDLYVGGYDRNSTGTGTFTQNGGDVVLSGKIILGSRKGTGEYIMNGGTLDVVSGITLGQNNNEGTGRFEMNGGTVITPTIKYVKGIATTTALNGGTLQAKVNNNTAFLDSLGEVTVGGITIDTTSSAYALGVTSGTTLKAAPGATPAITLAGSGTLDLSGTTLDLSATPSSNVYVLGKVADGASGTFAGAPASLTVDGAALDRWHVKLSKNGKQIVVVSEGLAVIIR